MVLALSFSDIESYRNHSSLGDYQNLTVLYTVWDLNLNVRGEHDDYCFSLIYRRCRVKLKV